MVLNVEKTTKKWKDVEFKTTTGYSEDVDVGIGYFGTRKCSLVVGIDQNQYGIISFRAIIDQYWSYFDIGPRFIVVNINDNLRTNYLKEGIL